MQYKDDNQLWIGEMQSRDWPMLIGKYKQWGAKVALYRLHDDILEWYELTDDIQAIRILKLWIETVLIDDAPIPTINIPDVLKTKNGTCGRGSGGTWLIENWSSLLSPGLCLGKSNQEIANLLKAKYGIALSKETVRQYRMKGCFR